MDVDSAILAKAQGFLRSLLSFQFYFTLLVIIMVFEQIEILNTQLQKTELCVNDSHSIVKAVMENIQHMRKEEVFSNIWSDIIETANRVGVDKPVLNRQRNPPKWREYTSNNATHIYSSPEELYRKLYFEIVDTTVTSLQTRFDSETMNLLNKFEKFITGKEDVEVSDITDFYNCSKKQSSNDNRQNELDGKNEKMLLLNAINADENFKTEFEELKEYQVSKNASKSRSKPKAASADRRYINVTNNSNNRLNLKHIVLYLKSKPEIQPIFNEVMKFVKLLMTVPGSSCTNERSFSVLRRLKSYLRSTMAQSRLNNVTVLNIYNEELNDEDIEELLNIFIDKHNIRRQTFAMICYNKKDRK